MPHTQFISRTTYALSTAARTPLVLPAPGHPEQCVTLIVETADQHVMLCTDAAGTPAMALPNIPTHSVPFSVGGLRLASGPLWLTATSGTPSVTIVVILEN